MTVLQFTIPLNINADILLYTGFIFNMHMSINGYNAQIVIVIPGTCVNDMFKKTTSNEHKTRDTTLKSSRLITYEDSDIQIVDNDHLFLLKHVKAVKKATGTKYDMYGK